METASVAAVVTIIVCLAVVLGASVVAFILSRGDIRLLPALAKAKSGVDFARSLAEALKPFLPGVAAGTIDLAVTLASKAVGQAEAAYKAALRADPDAADERKKSAMALIESALTLEGVTLDDKTRKMISAVIDTLVLALPKTHTQAA